MSNAIETLVIDIPAGSKFVQAAYIVQSIAERLSPILNASIDLESLPKEFHADASEWARCADLEAKDRQMNLRNRHFWKLNAAAEAREIALISSEDHAQIFSMERGALMKVEDARRYLEPMGFELHEVPEERNTDATPLDSDMQSTTKPLPRQRHQENEILRVIRELGHDPLKLPPQSQGKRWVAADVRDKLTGPEWTRSIHEKAWQRLRDNGEIKEG